MAENIDFSGSAGITGFSFCRQNDLSIRVLEARRKVEFGNVSKSDSRRYSD